MQNVDILLLAFVLLANAYMLARIRDPRLALVAMLIFNVFVLGLAVANMSDAQSIPADVAASSPARRRRSIPRVVRRATRARVLAVMAWAEGGARVSPGEVAAFDAVVSNRRNGRPYVRSAYSYSVGLRNPRHRWLFGLDPDDVPARLPEYVREEWPRLVAVAEAVVRGEVDHECDGRLVHWGGTRVDAHTIRRLVRRGHRRARCPEGYANTFLVRVGR